MSLEVQTRDVANKNWVGGVQKSIFGGKNMMGGIGNGFRSHPNSAVNRIVRFGRVHGSAASGVTSHDCLNAKGYGGAPWKCSQGFFSFLVVQARA